MWLDAVVISKNGGVWEEEKRLSGEETGVSPERYCDTRVLLDSFWEPNVWLEGVLIDC